MPTYLVVIHETRRYEGSIAADSAREARETAEAIVDPLEDGFTWETTETRVVIEEQS